MPSRRALAWDLAMVAVAVALVVALNVHWATLNQAPPRSDDNTHLFNSLVLMGKIAQADSFGEALSQFILFPGHYPPLVYETTVLAYGMIGRAATVPVLSLSPFLLALALGMYGIGLRIGGRMLGLACAFVGLFSPVVLEFSRLYFLDMPVAGMLALALCCLLHSQAFQRRDWALGFGIAMALGLLAKWVLLVFLLPFIAISCWQAIRATLPRWWMRAGAVLVVLEVTAFLAYVILRHAWDPEVIFGADRITFRFSSWALWTAVALAYLVVLRLAFRRRPEAQPLLNMVESLCIAVSVSWPWYYYNGEHIWQKMEYQAGVHVPLVDVLRMNIADLSTMVHLAPLLLLVGAGVGLHRRELRFATLTLLGALAVSFAFIVTIPPDSRYLMPVIVFVVPLCFLWVAPMRRWGATPVALVLGVGIFQATAYATLSPGNRAVEVRRDVKYMAPLYLSARPLVPPYPDRGSYPYQDLLHSIHWQTPQPGEDGKVVAAPTWIAVLAEPDDAAELQPRSLMYYAELNGYTLWTVEPFEALKSGWAVAGELKLCRQFLLIYRRPEGRAALMRIARDQSWIQDPIPTAAIFRFSPDFQVELLAPLDAQTGLQEAPGAGP